MLQEELLMDDTVVSASRLPAGHPVVDHGRIGVLIVNLGTPEATGYWPVRRYLKEFLSDPRVIETNRALWWVILNGAILTFRPWKSGHAYARIWNAEADESPLKTFTRAQAEGLAAAFRGAPRINVDWAMRYGLPPIRERIEALVRKGCDRILIFPLYPQYSATTTATVYDSCFAALSLMRWQPTIRGVPPYYDHPAYIAALAASLDRHLASLPWKPDKILASFHGLPETYLQKGDPYHCHCQKTTRLLGEALGLGPESLLTTFQSRFGRAEWLKPYTAESVAELARTGSRSLVVITPGFASDCVETLEEIAIGVGELFHASGGKNFSVVPCLNDSPESIDLLATLIRQELAGWA
jgi:protoporphyrin/coproporphyrin ferrochelatase